MDGSGNSKVVIRAAPTKPHLQPINEHPMISKIGGDSPPDDRITVEPAANKSSGTSTSIVPALKLPVPVLHTTDGGLDPLMWSGVAAALKDQANLIKAGNGSRLTSKTVSKMTARAKRDLGDRELVNVRWRPPQVGRPLPLSRNRALPGLFNFRKDHRNYSWKSGRTVAMEAGLWVMDCVG